MNILITGSNGFVGKNLVERLRKNHYVIGTGTRSSSAVQVDRYIKWDLAYEEIPNELQKMKIDVIIHAAASIDMNDDSRELILSNCVGTHKIFILNQILNTKLSILVSSVPVVGIPQKERISEDLQVNPFSMYHVTKVTQELMLKQLEKYGIRNVNLRIPSPIGPGMQEKTILPVFIRQAMRNQDIVLSGKGTRKQNYLDVRDLARAVELLIDSPASGTYNIGAEYPISNVELAELCISQLNSKSQICFSGKEDLADEQVWDISTDKLNTIIDFKQEYSIEDSIRDIYANMCRKGEL